MHEPVAKQVPHTWQRPDGPIDDPFAWLSHRDDPDTVAYLAAENASTDAWFAPRADLVEELFQEIRSRVQETDVSAPVPKDAWFYGARTVEGIDKARFERHCGRPLEKAVDGGALADLIEAGFLEDDGTALRASAEGRQRLNAVIARLLA